MKTGLLAFLCTGALVAAENSPVALSIDTKPLNGGGPQQVVSYADVLDLATPAVVAVYTEEIVEVKQSGRSEELEDMFRYFGIPVPPQNGGPNQDSEPVERRRPVGVGSGVIVSADGYIITNHHVVTHRNGEPVDEIRVSLSDDREFSAKLVGSDRQTDVAVLKIESDEPLPTVTIADSSNLRVGDVVFAIGNPLGVGLTATQGIISATGRTSLGILGRNSYEDFIQTDAAINMGNSGGALVDARGRLIGINTAIVSGSGGSIGIGFAIPANMVLNVLTNIVESGEVPRGLLGLLPGNLSRELAEAFGLDSTRGALVERVMEGSPADDAGLRHGDIILKVDDIEIESAPDLRLKVSQMMPGTEVKVLIFRDGDELRLPVVLGSVGEFTPSGTTKKEVLKGVVLGDLDAEARGQFALPKGVDGIVVLEVGVDSPYSRDLAPGMVLIELNGKTIESIEDFGDRLKEGANRVYAWMNGRHGYVVIKVED